MALTFRTNMDISVEKMGGRKLVRRLLLQNSRRRRPGPSRAVGMDTALKDSLSSGALVVGVI